MSARPPADPAAATYRLQFHGGFTFADASSVAPYLARLGVGACYCSPLLTARPGSTHGYDISDHSELNPELGGINGFERFHETLDRHRLGLILDFVPNHMGADPSANRYWRSVLENGPSSPYARFFDIDWHPISSELDGKVLFPILGAQYGVVLENAELHVVFENGWFSLRYYERNLPLNPGYIGPLLRHRLDQLVAEIGSDDPALKELLSILFHLDHLPVYAEGAPEHILERLREKEVAQERLGRLADASPRIRQHIAENVETFNGRAGDTSSFDLLHELLERQSYRLAYWRTALHDINYRRFFDINDLIALRMEDDEVFATTHELLLRMVQQGRVTGIRLDHVDGLFDPAAYFKRLAAACPRPVHTVIEKILSAGESLVPGWEVHGTTGYEFLNEVNGVLVDPAGVLALKKIYSRFTGRQDPVADVVYESKRLIVMTSMVSELNVLARALRRIAESNRRCRDYTFFSLQEALREIVACFPVYRTYVTEQGASDFDRRTIDTAVSRALRRNPAVEPSIFQFIRSVLIPTPGDAERLHFAMKFQQYTGPVQAKGLEDTAFYRHAPLLSLNEVGGDPSRFARTVDEFHQSNTDRLAFWPLSMLATSTHDTKRGEDARARIDVISEIPDEWRAHLVQWTRATAGMRGTVHGQPAPDRHNEYFYYQALLGAWPPRVETPDADFVERMRQYLLKAIHEEKVHTSWINPSQEYDDAVAEFVRRTLAGQRSRRFLSLFVPFAMRIARLGVANSLAQLVLKIASPGVPDFYQGTELWDLSLVDPDSRRPVDFQARCRMLGELESIRGPEEVAGLLERWEDGRIKMHVMVSALRLRRAHPDLFLRGEYIPLESDANGHVIAFARRWEGQVAIAVTGRSLARLDQSFWQGRSVRVPMAELRDVISGQVLRPEHGALRLADVFSVCPVALLHTEAAA
jgi:(1->4)-alpha-D-glucan 1-alpha-D-glucosylmutase